VAPGAGPHFLLVLVPGLFRQLDRDLLHRDQFTIGDKGVVRGLYIIDDSHDLIAQGQFINFKRRFGEGDLIARIVYPEVL
jgi:hypothetical protein